MYNFTWMYNKFTWRDLSATEEQQFRQWARDNYLPLDDIDGLWHPVVKDECQRINEEYVYTELGIDLVL